MSAALVIFVFIHLVVFVFFVETLRRVYKRSSEYSLEDTRETVPFGLVRLRHIVILYVVGYLVWIIVSIVLYLTFVSPDSSLSIRNGPRSRTTGSMQLDL